MTSHPEFGAATDGATVAKAFSNSISGKTILITGVSPNGLGMSTAESLAAHHPHLLILTGRNPEKVRKVIDHLMTAYPATKYRYLHLDLSSFDQVKKSAEEIMGWSDVEKIDLLVCNAGVMAINDHEMSVDDIEMQFATNYLGHFLFTNLILPKLIESSRNSPRGATRIINVSSVAHQFSPVRFSDTNFCKGQNELPEEERANSQAMAMVHAVLDDRCYNPYVAYGQSKTAVILSTLALNRRLNNKYNIRCYTLHPGAVATELFRHIDEETVNAVVTSSTGVFFKTPAQGCSTTLVAALDPGLPAPDENGNNFYLDDCQLSTESLAPWARQTEGAEKLWQLSQQLSGQVFSY